jgi:hypothetical protein
MSPKITSGFRFSACLLALLCFSFGCQPSVYAKQYFGDFTGDGTVNIQDIVKILKFAIKLESLTADQQLKADIAPVHSDGTFGDGIVNVSDAIRLLKFSVASEVEPWPARRVIIKLTKGANVGSDIDTLNDFANALKDDSGNTLTSVVPDPDHPGSFIGVINPDKPRVDDQEILQALKTNASASSNEDLIEDVQPDYINVPTLTPSDPLFGQQWNLDKIGASAGWNVTTGNNKVVIAILDSGVDPINPDMAGRIALSQDFTPSKKNTDLYGHGTHVAGIAAAGSNNGTGITGLCWSCQVLSVRVLDSLGFGLSSSSASGIRWVIEQAKAHPDQRYVINMSYTKFNPSDEELAAVREAASAGIVLVAAAGNGGTEEIGYPAGYKEVLSVAATDQDDQRASFSNYGDWVSVAAPGVGIESLLPANESFLGDKYGKGQLEAQLSGTSQASPLVAGLAGLILSVNPLLTRDQVKDLIVNNADTILGDAKWQQFKRINVAKTLAALTPAPGGNVPPNPPILKGPEDGTKAAPGLSITFEWEDGGDPDNGPDVNRKYEFELLAADQKQLADSGTISGTSFSWQGTATAGTYSWHVRSFDGAVWSEWSEVGSVKVVAPVTTKLLSVSSNLPGVVLVTVSPKDLDNKSDGTTTFSRMYDTNASVTLTAPLNTANGTATFQKWTMTSGGQTTEKTDNPLALAMDADKSVTAVYNVGGEVHTLMVNTNPAGVSVQVSPQDKSGASGGSGPFTRIYPSGTPVTLTAAPEKESGNSLLVFDHWETGAGPVTANIILVNLDGDRTVTAVYKTEPLLRTLTVNSHSNVGGITGISISVTPKDNDGKDNGVTTFTRSYLNGSKVILTAPSPTSLFGKTAIFQHWDISGEPSQTTASTPLTMDKDKTATAIYTIISNSAPALSVPDNLSVATGQPLSFQISATDPEGDDITYSVSNLPSGASFNPLTLLFSWAPGATQAGDYTLSFNASDGKLSTTKNVSIHVEHGSHLIFTIAGGGTAGVGANGFPGTYLQLAGPRGVAIDGQGSIYFSDRNANRVYKLDRNGISTAIAGNGSQGFSGDGGPASAAKLFNPMGVALDKAGNLYIADGENHRVRKVDLNGIIATVAGGGSQDVNTNGSQKATDVRFGNLSGMAVDSIGNLYVGDNGTLVYKITPDGDLTVYAGGGSSVAGGPARELNLGIDSQLVIGPGDALYIASIFNKRVFKVDTTGIATVVAGGGNGSGENIPATGANLGFIYGVAVDGSGNIYLSETEANRVWKVNTAGLISTYAGTGISGFSGDGGPAIQAKLNTPSNLSVDPEGSLFIADEGNARIRKVTPN